MPPSGAIAVIVVDLLMSVGIAAVFIALGLTPLGIAVLVLNALALAAGIAYQPAVNPRIAARQVHLFEHGFIHTRAAGPVGDYRWDAVATLETAMFDFHTAGGTYTGRSSTRVKVTRYDGATVTLTQFYDEIETLGRILASEVTRAQLPRAVATLRSGQQVRFGDLAIDSRGVSAGGRLLPWGEVESVQARQGYVEVRQAGQRWCWLRRQVAVIPNVHLFLALTDQGRRAAGAVPDTNS
jgi:hypothetical protein